MTAPACRPQAPPGLLVSRRPCRLTVLPANADVCLNMKHFKNQFSALCFPGIQEPLRVSSRRADVENKVRPAPRAGRGRQYK